MKSKNWNPGTGSVGSDLIANTVFFFFTAQECHNWPQKISSRIYIYTHALILDRPSLVCGPVSVEGFQGGAHLALCINGHACTFIVREIAMETLILVFSSTCQHHNRNQACNTVQSSHIRETSIHLVNNINICYIHIRASNGCGAVVQLLLRGCLVNKVELGELGHVSSTKHSVHSVQLVLVLLLQISSHVRQLPTCRANILHQTQDTHPTHLSSKKRYQKLFPM